MIIEWRTIPEYKGIYKISSNGEVRSLPRFRSRRENTLKINHSSNGYDYYALSKEGKTKKIAIHRLMAITFLPNPNGLQWVNHKDGNKKNNSLSNLEWISPKDNKRHAIDKGLQLYKRGEDNKNAILTNKQVEYIRKMHPTYNKSQLSEIFNVSKTLIHFIIIGKNR